MGFLDRVKGIAAGIGGATFEVAALAGDVVSSLWNDDDEFNGSLVDVIAARADDRLGNAAAFLAGDAADLSGDGIAVRGGRRIAGFNNELGLKAAVGALPEGVRAPLRPVGEGLETFGREAIREPIATAVLAGELAMDSPTAEQQGFGDLWSWGTWQEAHRLSQTTSVGQAVTYGLREGIDILDPEQVEDFHESSWFQVASGTVDMMARAFLEPDVILTAGAAGLRNASKAKRSLTGGVESAAKARERFHAPGGGFDAWNSKVNEFRTQAETTLRQRIDADTADLHAQLAANTGELQDMLRLGGDDLDAVNALDGAINEIQAALDDAYNPRRIKEQATAETAGRIRNMLDDGPGADALAWSLAHADTPDLQRLVWDVFSGDTGALSRLRDMDFVLANQIHRNIIEIDELKAFDGALEDLDLIDWRGSDYGRQLQAELDANVSTQTMIELLIESSGSLDELKAPSWLDVTIDRAANSATIRNGAIGKTVRYLFEKTPERGVDLNSELGGRTFDRWLDGSGMDPDWVNRWRGQYARAVTPAERAETIHLARDAWFSEVARGAGLSANEVQDILRTARSEAERSRTVVPDRRFDGAPEHARRDAYIAEDTDEIIIRALSKTQSADTMFLPDVNTVRTRLERHAQLKDSGMLDVARVKLADSAAVEGLFESMNEITSAFKIGALLRPAYPIRTTLFDNTLRMMAKVGIATTMLEQGKGLGRIASRFSGEYGPLGGALGGAATGAILGGPIGAAIGAGGGALAAGMLRRVAPKGRLLALKHAGPMDPFYNPDRVFGMTSASGMYREFIAQDGRQAAKLIRDERASRAIVPDDPNYGASFAETVNRQFRQDDLYRQALAGASAEKMASWLTDTKAGSRYRMDVAGWTPSQAKQWAQAIRSQVDDYFGAPDPTDVAAVKKSRALQQQARKGDIDASFADQIDMRNRATIHGTRFAAAGPLQGMVAKGAELARNALDVMATLPDDELARNPFFRIAFDAEMAKRTDLLGTSLTPGEWARVAEQARQKAMLQVRDLFYNPTERTSFARDMKHMVPFLPAGQEAIARWAHLAVENPVFVTRMTMAYNGLKNDSIWTEVDPETGESWLSLQLPGWARDLPFFEDYMKVRGGMDFSVSSMNMILNAPGFGWLATVPASKIVWENPALEDDLEWLLPYGPTDGAFGTENIADLLAGSIEPTLLKRIRGKYGEDHARDTAKVAQLLVTQMDLGILPRLDPANPEEADEFARLVSETARNMARIDAVVKLFSPTGVRFNSIFQTQIDALRAEYEKGDVFTTGLTGEPIRSTPKDRFLANHGVEFAALTLSVSDNKAGLLPTVEAWEALAAGETPKTPLQKMLSRSRRDDPSLTRWLLGLAGTPDATQQESMSVWRKLTRTETYPGSGEYALTVKGPVALLEEAEASDGWREFTQISDIIEARQKELGYANLNLKEALWLRDLRTDAVAELRAQNPTWAKAYDDGGDRGLFARRLDLLKTAAADPSLAGRAEVAPLNQYLAEREWLLAELERRGTGITAEANYDLALAWDGFVADLRASSPAFARTYDYLLSNDPLTQETR